MVLAVPSRGDDASWIDDRTKGRKPVSSFEFFQVDAGIKCESQQNSVPRLSGQNRRKISAAWAKTKIHHLRLDRDNFFEFSTYLWAGERRLRTVVDKFRPARRAGDPLRPRDDALRGPAGRDEEALKLPGHAPAVRC